MDFTQIATLVLVPVGRSLAGWASNALEDSKITTFEWTQLASTVLRVGMIGFGTFFGLGGLGLDVTAIGAAGSALVLDFILSAVKKGKEVVATK